jgi:cytochrome c556
MSDIVERLRQYEGAAFETTACYNGTRDEAADEIERLRAENKLLNEKVIDAQTCFERANADVERITADTDRVWGSMPAAVEKIAKMEAERDRLRAALKEAADELDAYYAAEYAGDHPYMVKKLAEAKASNPARVALIDRP